MSQIYQIVDKSFIYFLDSFWANAAKFKKILVLTHRLSHSIGLQPKTGFYTDTHMFKDEQGVCHTMRLVFANVWGHCRNASSLPAEDGIISWVMMFRKQYPWPNRSTFGIVCTAVAFCLEELFFGGLKIRRVECGKLIYYFSVLLSHIIIRKIIVIQRQS